MYYQVLIDENNIKQGIVELRFIDPRKIRRIKNIKKEKTPQGVEVVKEVEEYYLYNDKGITEPAKAMPEEYKVDDVVESYRNYYRGAKKDFATWKMRSVPEWF